MTDEQVESIKKLATAELKRRAATKIPSYAIVVSTFLGSEITVNVKANDTINRVKAKIHDEIGIATKKQRIVFVGKELVKGKISAYGVVDSWPR